MKNVKWVKGVGAIPKYIGLLTGVINGFVDL